MAANGKGVSNANNFLYLTVLQDNEICLRGF